MTRNIPADVRSARLLKLVRAFVLAHPDLPASTRSRLLDMTRSIRLLAETDTTVLVISGCRALEVLIREVGTDTTSNWRETLTGASLNLRKAVEK